MAYVKALLQHLSQETEENFEKLWPGDPLPLLRSELGASRTHRRITIMPQHLKTSSLQPIYKCFIKHTTEKITKLHNQVQENQHKAININQ
jgi:hypothetical protein